MKGDHLEESGVDSRIILKLDICEMGLVHKLD
jgi:hypothetical protein